MKESKKAAKAAPQPAEEKATSAPTTETPAIGGDRGPKIPEAGASKVSSVSLQAQAPMGKNKMGFTIIHDPRKAGIGFGSAK